MKEQTTYKKDALNRFSVSDAGKQAAGMYVTSTITVVSVRLSTLRESRHTRLWRMR